MWVLAPVCVCVCVCVCVSAVCRLRESWNCRIIFFFFSTQEQGEGNGAWIILSSDPLVLASERVLCWINTAQSFLMFPLLTSEKSSPLESGVGPLQAFFSRWCFELKKKKKKKEKETPALLVWRGNYNTKSPLTPTGPVKTHTHKHTQIHIHNTGCC